MTEFQKDVLSCISKIPYGKLTTYKNIALKLGKPKSYRAVANACGENPNPIIVPCHRVVLTNGNLGGYSGEGGTQKKAELLKSEGIDLNNINKFIVKL